MFSFLRLPYSLRVKKILVDAISKKTSKKRHDLKIVSQTVDKSCSKLVTRAWNSFLSTSFRIFEQKNKGSLPFHSQVANFFKFIAANTSIVCVATFSKPRYLVQRIPCFSFASANIRSIVCFRFCKLIYSDLLGEDVPLHPSDLPKHVS